MQSRTMGGPGRFMTTTLAIVLVLAMILSLGSSAAWAKDPKGNGNGQNQGQGNGNGNGNGNGQGNSDGQGQGAENSNGHNHEHSNGNGHTDHNGNGYGHDHGSVPQPPQVEPTAPQVEPTAPQVEPTAPQAQPPRPQAPPQLPPQAQPQLPPQAQPPHVQPQPPQVEPTAPQVEPTAPQVEPTDDGTGPGRSDRLSLNVTSSAERLDCSTRTLTFLITPQRAKQGDTFPRDAYIDVKAPSHMTVSDVASSAPVEQTLDSVRLGPSLTEGATYAVTFILDEGFGGAATAAGVVKSNYSRAYPINTHIDQCDDATPRPDDEGSVIVDKSADTSVLDTNSGGKYVTYNILVRRNGGSPSSTVRVIDTLVAGCPNYAWFEEITSENVGFTTQIDGCTITIVGDAKKDVGNVFHVKVRLADSLIGAPPTITNDVTVVGPGGADSDTVTIPVIVPGSNVIIDDNPVVIGDLPQPPVLGPAPQMPTPGDGDDGSTPPSAPGDGDDGDDGSTPPSAPGDGDDGDDGSTPPSAPAHGDDDSSTPPSAPGNGDDGDADSTPPNAPAPSENPDDVANAPAEPGQAPDNDQTIILPPGTIIYTPEGEQTLDTPTSARIPEWAPTSNPFPGIEGLIPETLPETAEQERSNTPLIFTLALLTLMAGFGIRRWALS